MNTSYPGKWLVINLTSGEITKERIAPEVIKTFLGGRGIGAKQLWDRVPVDTDPLSAENVLIFAPGTLTGTSAPCSGRTTLLAKGPSTGYYLKTNVGGHLGIALKMAGTDGLVFTGQAAQPVYFVVTPDSCRLEPARKLWGQGVRTTTQALKEQYGQEAQIACIGPAGERQVLFASVMTSMYNAAARGGIGAVMGSKNLKAVVVDPAGGRVNVTDPTGFVQAAQRARDALYNDSIAHDLHKFGTARDVDLLNELHLLPTFNFRRSKLPGEVYSLSGRSWSELGYLRRIVGCGACIYSCHRFTGIERGPFGGTYSGGPEYETVAAFGSGCGVLDPEPVFAANALCNDLGLDTISTGNVIQWAMECTQRGILTPADCDGIELSFGAGNAVVKVVEKIAYREGIGDLLAEGVARAAKKVGKGSDQWAIQARGLEHSNVETRGAYSYALAFAVNPRGPDHLHSECLAEFGGTPEGIQLIERVTGDKKYAVPNVEDKRAEIVRWHEDIYAISDALGICAFATTAAYSLHEDLIANLLKTATGIALDVERLMRAGKRIGTLERCFNLREGLVPKKDDILPWRIMHEPQQDLSPGEPITPERLGRMLAEYYRLHGWNTIGYPTQRTLVSLGLEFILTQFPQLAANQNMRPSTENRSETSTGKR